MAKQKSEYKIADEQLKNIVNDVNNLIDVLGTSSENVINAIRGIQHIFDKIRGVPSKHIVTYNKVKKISSEWAEQVRNIQQEYSDCISTSTKTGAAIGAVGTGIATLAPSAAMGIATTFGVASTGTAIADLSGAVATRAALAWLGGGAVAAGGGGMAAGQLLLTLAGPVGWALTAASFTVSGFFFYRNYKSRKRMEEIFTLVAKRDYRKYLLAQKEIKEKNTLLSKQASRLHKAIVRIKTFGLNYTDMSEEQQYELGTFVNEMLIASETLSNPINALIPVFNPKVIDKIYQDSSEYRILSSKQKIVVINFCEFLHKIWLEEGDSKIIYKTFKGNKDYMKSTELTKEKFTQELVDLAIKLRRKGN